MPQLSPDVVFYVFLPPLLYYAAYFIAPDDLRANARPIGLLSVGLVIVTTATVAGVLVGVAGVPLAVALVAGAVVAPTDAVAATSVFARLDVPERLVTIVEGEGLTNDGTALVLYTGAVGAAMVGAVRPGPLAVTLLAAPAGGAALGLAVAWLAVQVRRRIDHPYVGDHALAGDAVPHLCARRGRPSLGSLGHGDRRAFTSVLTSAQSSPRVRDCRPLPFSMFWSSC